MQRIRHLLMSPALLLYAGTIVRSGMGFLMGVLVARQFGVEAYGLFTVYIVVLMITLAVFGEALDHGLVRFLSYRLAHDADRTGEVVGSALALRLGMILAGSAVGLIVLTILPENPAQTELRKLVAAGLVAGTAASFFAFANAILVSREQFLQRSFSVALISTVRFIVMVTVAFMLMVDLSVLIAVDVAAIIAFSVAAVLWVRRSLRGMRVSRKMLGDLFSFSKWGVVSTTSYLLYMTLGGPLLLYFEGAAAAGIYGAAVTIAIFAEHASAAFVSVQQQRASKIRTEDEQSEFLRATTRISLLCAAVLVPFGFLAGPVIVLAYGFDFALSAAIFPVIFAGSLVNLITMPRAMIFMVTDRPDRIAKSTVAGLVTWVPVVLLMIPAFGVWGAAFSILTARVVQGLAICWHVRVAGFQMAETGT